MISVRADASDFSNKFPLLITQARKPRALLLGVAHEGVVQLRSHFAEKERTNVNKLAPDRRSNIWLRIRRSVNASPVVLSDTSVGINISDPVIAQKVFGGPIIAKRVKNLSIPLEEDAYNRTPAVYERETGFKLFVIHKNSQLLLVRRLADQGVKVEYLLTPRVDQAADPTALPDEQLFLEKLLARGQAILDSQLKQS